MGILQNSSAPIVYVVITWNGVDATIFRSDRKARQVSQNPLDL